MIDSDETIIWIYGIIIGVIFGGGCILTIVKNKTYILFLFFIPFIILYLLYFTSLSFIPILFRLLIFGGSFILVYIVVYWFETR
ncbi:hypothetical protein SAMN04488168_101267 [Bacillus sp. 491mf]|nr:hypothetical protein SAMN04488168_101267 [Bacillus sp. 491mf]